MDPRTRAELTTALTTEVLVAIASETLRAQPKAEVADWLRKRVHVVVRSAGGEADTVDAVMDEILGLGPLEPLLRDQTIHEIDIQGPTALRIRRGVEWEPAPVAFKNELHLRAVFDRIFLAAGKHPRSGPVTAQMVDGSQLVARLEDGELRATIVRPTSG